MAIIESEWRMVDRNGILPTRKTVRFFGDIRLYWNHNQFRQRVLQEKERQKPRHIPPFPRHIPPIFTHYLAGKWREDNLTYRKLINYDFSPEKWCMAKPNNLEHWTLNLSQPPSGFEPWTIPNEASENSFSRPTCSAEGHEHLWIKTIPANNRHEAEPNNFEHWTWNFEPGTLNLELFPAALRIWTLTLQPTPPYGLADGGLSPSSLVGVAPQISRLLSGD